MIESTLRRMKEKMKECKDVEELSYVHTQFTSSLQYQCLLSDKVPPNLIPRSLLKSYFWENITDMSSFQQSTIVSSTS